MSRLLAHTSWLLLLGCAPSPGSVQPSTTSSEPTEPTESTAQNQPVVGTMDKEVIHRVVRMHVQEVKNCYKQGLSKDPSLAGQVSIEFTISPTGKVDEAKATDVSGFADPEVPTCIAEAIEQWVFPEPRGGGEVAVRYPFNLSPD